MPVQAKIKNIQEVYDMAVTTITNSNFNSEVEKSGSTTLVDFWASWCGPCQMMSPVVDELADEMPDIKVGKVNVDEEPELASRFGVMSIPTLIVFKNGAEADRVVGVTPKEEIVKML